MSKSHEQARADFQQQLDEAPRGQALALAPHEIPGPVIINNPLTLDGQGATFWALQGPVVSVQSGGVVLRNLKIEVTGGISGDDPEQSCALLVQAGANVRLENVEVRGLVIGLEEEEGPWRYPTSLHLGQLAPDTDYQFTVRLVVPVPCDLTSNISGLEIKPRHLPAGRHEVVLRVEGLFPDTLLTGTICLASRFVKRSVMVSAHALSAQSAAAAPPVVTSIVWQPPDWDRLEHTERPPVVVSQEGGGQFRTLTEAVQSCVPGTRISVRPGLYREAVILDRQVEIAGDGPAADIIIESVDGSCLRLQTDNARVRGLTLRCKIGPGGGNYPAVDLPGGKLILEDCSITSNSLACVAIHGPLASPILRRCKIHGGKAAGVLVSEGAAGLLEKCDIFENALSGVEIKESANPRLRGCRIANGRQTGVLVHDQGKGVLEDCAISGNALAGVEIRDGGDPILRRCTVHDGQYPGVYVWENGRGVLEECDISGNALAGVEIKRGGNPVIRRSRIHRGKQAGVFCSMNSLGTLVDCEIMNNALAGVEIKQNSNPTFQKCKIHDNQQAGVLVSDAGEGLLEDCDIRGNQRAGVAILRGGNPSLRRCKIARGNRFGLVVEHEGRGTLEDCEISETVWSAAAVSHGGNPTLRKCRLHHSRQCDLMLRESGQATVEECDIRDNGMAGVSSASRAQPDLRHCRIQRNGDVGVWVHDLGACRIEQCDLTDNAFGSLDIQPGCPVVQSQRA